MDKGFEVVFGFVGGGHETSAVADESRALAIANVIMGKTGGPAAWVSLHPDADAHRLAVCLKTGSAIQTIRIRHASNGDASPAPEPEPAPAPAPAPEPETSPNATNDPPVDARH